MVKVAVVGLGKIGLPLAVQFASSGHKVIGVDINSSTVETINAGHEPFPGEANLEATLGIVVASGALRATPNYGDAIPEADIVLVLVPLTIDNNHRPDFSQLDRATESIAEHLSPHTLVIYETTLPVGTTRGRWKPKLEEGSGMTEGVDFDLVFSPERVLTGRIFEDLKRYPKLVGALSQSGAARARDFYESVIDFIARDDLPDKNGVWDLGAPEAAEMAKLAETTYRDVNIALANQFAIHADELGLDIYEIIQASNSQPFSHIHKPGISVGGHCIPVYPRLYLATDLTSGVVEAARDINEAVPTHLISRLERFLGDLEGKRALILGVSYRPGVKEAAYSGVFRVEQELTKRAAIVTVLDPYFSDQEIRQLGLAPHSPGQKVDVLVVHTEHPQFLDYSFLDFPDLECILDGRNHFSSSTWPEVPILTHGRPTIPLNLSSGNS